LINNTLDLTNRKLVNKLIHSIIGLFGQQSQTRHQQTN
jgi:hypothetical protein